MVIFIIKVLYIDYPQIESVIQQLCIESVIQWFLILSNCYIPIISASKVLYNGYFRPKTVIQRLFSYWKCYTLIIHVSKVLYNVGTHLESVIQPIYRCPSLLLFTQDALESFNYSILTNQIYFILFYFFPHFFCVSISISLIKQMYMSLLLCF